MKINYAAACAGLVLGGVALGQTGNLTADQILAKVRERPDGSDIYADATLTLREKDGSKRQRDLVYLQKDYGKDEKLTLYFTSPSDVRGVALQSVNYDEASAQEDDQWMYLPVFRQVRRIAASDKRGSFMGSQFSYIDLDKLRVTDYRQELAGVEKVGDRSCQVIERLPASAGVVKRTGYSKVRLWVDPETYVVLKQAFYDSKGVQFKEFLATKFEKIQNIWTVTESEMRDLVNQRSSVLAFAKVQYDAGLGDPLFQQNILKTGVRHGDLPKLP